MVTKKVNYNNEDYDIGADAKNIYLDVKDNKENRYSLQAKISDINKSIRLGPNSGNAIGEYSTAFGCDTLAEAEMSYAEGRLTSSKGRGSHSEGDTTCAGGQLSADVLNKLSTLEEYQNQVAGAASHAEGIGTQALKVASHAEGYKTQAKGMASHTEGELTEATGTGAHAEGYWTEAIGYSSHAEGYRTTAQDRGSHAEGGHTLAYGLSSHAEGCLTQAKGGCSHAEGYSTTSNGTNSHAEGQETEANANSSHVEGYRTRTGSNVPFPDTIIPPIACIASHAEGIGTCANNKAAHAEGIFTIAEGIGSHVEGNETIAQRMGGHAEGNLTQAIGVGAHAEGSAYSRPDGPASTEAVESNWRDFMVKEETITAQGPIAMGDASHAEGISTLAYGRASHTEGYGTLAQRDCSHAEGFVTSALGNYSHAEGFYTLAEGSYTHAEGGYNQAIGSYSHVEGDSNIIEGVCIHAEGQGHSKISNSVEGKFVVYSFSESLGMVDNFVGSLISSSANKVFDNRIYQYEYNLRILEYDNPFTEDGIYRGYSSGGRYALPYTEILIIYEGLSGTNSKFYSTKEIGYTGGAPLYIQEKWEESSEVVVANYSDYSHIQGRYSLPKENLAHIVGGGASDANRKNIHTIDWDGNAEFAGDVVLFGCGGSNPIQLSTFTKGPLIIQESMIGAYSAQGEYGDKILDAIQKNRQILILLTNQGGSNYSLYSPVITYHLPQEANTELSLFYLPDGISPTNFSIREAQFKVSNPIIFNDNLKN